jgi:hypothetical protein
LLKTQRGRRRALIGRRRSLIRWQLTWLLKRLLSEQRGRQ